MMENILLKCDNLKGLLFLRDEMGMRGKVDLVYIDPPFATGGVFRTDSNGRVATISSSNDGELAYSDKLKGEEFLEFLRERVCVIYDLLSDRGSFYLHIDYKIGHYVKVMLDSIFGIQNFRNDITRIKCNPKNFERIGYGNIKDMILFYTKTSNPIWNEPKEEVSENELIKAYPKIYKDGRRYTTIPIHAPGETKNGASSQPFKGIFPPKGRHWRCSIEELERLDEEGLLEWSANGVPRKINFADEHTMKRMQDIWTFKDPQHPIYPTEKNHEMLRTIIKTSSNPESIVLDCFAGSGGTLLCSAELERFWIGIDQSDIAIDTIRNNVKTDNLLFGQEFFNYKFIKL